MIIKRRNIKLNDIFRYKKIDRVRQIGKRIKDERRKKKLSQQKLADAISSIMVDSDPDYKGTEQNTVSNWEKGVSLPPLSKLIALSEIFDCDIGYLLCDYDEPTRNLADVVEQTGLSGGAATRLKNMAVRVNSERSAGWANVPEEQEIEALNAILENDYQILYYIYQYIFGNYDSFAVTVANCRGQEKDIVEKDLLLCNSSSPTTGTNIKVEQLQPIFLLSIQSALMDLKKKLNNTKQPHTKKTK